MTAPFRSARDEEEFDAAEALHEAGRWYEALAAFAAYLDRRLRAGGDLTAGDQVAAERVADLASLCGRPGVAVHMLAGLTRLNRGDEFLTDYFALKQADAAVGAGDYPAAEAAARTLEPRIGPLEAIPVEAAELPAWEDRCRWAGRRDPDRPLLFTRLYLALGGWLAGNGLYRHAAVLFARGARHAAPPASSLARRARVRLRLALAAAHLEHGSPAAADAVLREIAPEIDSARNPGWRAEWLGRAGHLALLTGRFGDALDHLEGVTEVCRRGGFPGAALTALLHQAQVLVSVNQVLAAEDTLAAADDLAAATDDPGAATRARWLRWLARNRGDSPLGDGHHHSVAALWGGWPEPGPGSPLGAGGPDPINLPAAHNFLAFFEDRALAVRWRAARGQLDAAATLLDQLRAVYAESDSLLIRLRLDALAGVLTYAAGDYETAGRAFAELVPHFERQGLRPELRDALRFLWWCGQRKEQPPPAAQTGVASQVVVPSTEPAVTALGLRIRALTDELADSLPTSQRAIWLLDKWADEERVLAAEVAELDRAREEAEEAPWWRRFWRRRTLRRRLTAHLDRLDFHREREARTAGGGADRAEPVLPAPRRLPRDQLMLAFQVFPDFTLVARLGGGRLDARVVPLTRLRVRELVARWHRRVGGDWTRTDDPAPVAEELATALQLEELLADLPRRVTRLVVVADDALHGFPFPALRVGGKYLVERFALSHRYDTRPDPRPGRPVSSAFVAAVPDGAPASEEFPAGIPPLPNAKVEADDTRARLERLGVSVAHKNGPDIDAGELLAAWSAAEFTHIACHGVFLPDEPDRSGLVVVGRAGVERVTLRQLFDADLSRVEHVTLSSCWGADNFVLPGRRVLSLPEAACRAGVGSVLAALWPVHDAAAREFAARFQDYLREHPRDVALQRTQCDFLRSVPQVMDERSEPPAPLPVAHPFFWSGYRLSGRAGRIRWQRGG